MRLTVERKRERPDAGTAIARRKRAAMARKGYSDGDGWRERRRRDRRRRFEYSEDTSSSMRACTS